MLLIDGYNLLFAAGLSGDLASQRTDVVTAVEALGRRARIVFDHTKGPPVYGVSRRPKGKPVEIWFTEKGVTADAEIIETLRSTRDVTAFTVISSDLAIVKEAERLKFRVLGSNEFWNQIVKRPPSSTGGPKEGGLSPGEADAWMREFGLEE